MATLADIRKQYPQYNDLSDADLADALYQTHYADMPRGEFDKAVGIKADQGLGFVRGVSTVAKNASDVTFKVNPLMAVSDLAAKATGAPAPSEVFGSSLDQLRRAVGGVPGRRPGKVGEWVGATAASAPTWFVPAGPLVQGAGQGYLMSGADDLKGKAIDSAMGAVGNKAGSFVFDKIGGRIAQAMTPEVRMLTDQGVSLTPGMMAGGKAMAAEDKLMSRPLVGDAVAGARKKTLETFNTATVNRVLSPLGIKVPDGVSPGNDAVAFAQNVVGQAYDQIVPRLSVAPDEAFLAGVQGAKTAASLLPGAMKSQVQATIKALGLEGDGLAGQALKNAQSELGRLSRSYRTSSVAAEREFGQILSGLRDNLDDLIERQAGELAPALKATNAAYRNLAIVEDAASRADEGVFGTGQLKQAARRSDGSARKRATAAGRGPMQDWTSAARKVIPAVTPDSGTAARLMSGSLPATAFAVPALVGFKAGQAMTRAMTEAAPEVLQTVRGVVTKLQKPAGVLGGLLPSMTMTRD